MLRRAFLTALPGAMAQKQTLWPMVKPEAAGMKAGVLQKLDADIAAGKYGHVDSMLVIRKGKTVIDKTYQWDYDKIYAAEARKTGALNAHDSTGPFNYFNPWWHPYYRRGDLHTLQSVTKTIASTVIGVAMTRKEFPSIDTPVLQYFDRTKVANVDERKQRITVRHLLTMTAGLDWNESLPYNDPNNSSSVMEASADWVQYTIDRPMAVEPGTLFNYSSGVSELLAHVFRAATGQDMEEYAARYLFQPLGIEKYFWKRTPWGLVDSEGGLYLERHDLAKIPYLFLQGGLWKGKRILDAEWVKAAVAPSVVVGGRAGVKYGYKWWLYPYGKTDARLTFAGSGFGGQLPVAVPDYELVMVFTAWNILGEKGLYHREAIDRVLEAVER